MGRTIAEENIHLKAHMMSVMTQEGWSTTKKLTNDSLEKFEKDNGWISEIDNVIIVGHGTSYATALVIESFMSRIANVRATALPAFVFANYASDYLKSTANSLVIGISCGGNTQAVINSFNSAKALGAKTMIISRDGDIGTAKAADYRLLSHADVENNVGSAYSISHLFLAHTGFELALVMGAKNGTLSAGDVSYWHTQFEDTLKTFDCLPRLFEEAEVLAKEYPSDKYKNFCVLGTGPNMGTMKEGALKIAEFCWVFGAGEELEDFAHGRFREVDSMIPLFIIAPKGPSVAKTLDLLAGSNISKTPTIIFTDDDNPALVKLATKVIKMPKIENEYLTPFLYCYPLWFYGWHIMHNNGGMVGDKRHGLLAKNINFKARYDDEGNLKE